MISGTNKGLLATIVRFARERHGAIMVEFALMLPVFSALVLGGFEFARYAMVNQKMDRVVGFVGDLVARAESLVPSDFVDYFAAAEQLASPFDVMAGGNIIVTSVTGESSGPEVLWQQIGPGMVNETSHVGLPGNPATLPAGFVLEEDENVVITEVWYDFVPLFFPQGSINGNRLYYQSVFRPRTTAVLAMQQSGS